MFNPNRNRATRYVKGESVEVVADLGRGYPRASLSRESAEISLLKSLQKQRSGARNNDSKPAEQRFGCDGQVLDAWPSENTIRSIHWPPSRCTDSADSAQPDSGNIIWSDAEQWPDWLQRARQLVERGIDEALVSGLLGDSGILLRGVLCALPRTARMPSAGPI